MGPFAKENFPHGTLLLAKEPILTLTVIKDAYKVDFGSILHRCLQLLIYRFIIHFYRLHSQSAHLRVNTCNI